MDFERERIFDKVYDEGGYIDLEDYNLAWTWFDDDGENCGTSKLEALKIDTDCNGVSFVSVEFDDRSEILDYLDYEDVLGNNFVEWLYCEL